MLFQVELVMSLNNTTRWWWLVGTYRFSRDCNALSRNLQQLPGETMENVNKSQ